MFQYNHYFVDLLLQLTVRATDNRIRSALATVRIFITRQINQPPVFVNTPYETTIESSRQINSTVYTVTAVDSDLQVGCRAKIYAHCFLQQLFHAIEMNYVPLIGQTTLICTNFFFSRVLFAMKWSDTSQPPIISHWTLSMAESVW